MSTTAEALLRMEGITKSFSGVTALAGVNLTLERGEVHALVGENGAGKSTLIKIMTGAYRRDGGEMNITVESNPRFGPLAFDTLEKFLRGEQIPPKIILEDRFFDKNNAQQFVNEAY